MSKMDQMTFMPFGHGPRNCIASRFAKTEVKLAAATLLAKYTVCPTANTPVSYKLEQTDKFINNFFVNLNIICSNINLKKII